VGGSSEVRPPSALIESLACGLQMMDPHKTDADFTLRTDEASPAAQIGLSSADQCVRCEAMMLRPSLTRRIKHCADGLLSDDGLHLKEQEAIVAQCEQECDRILSLVDANVLGVPTERFVRPDHETRSKVGLILKDCLILDMLTGSPASMSRKFQKGDVVVAIDNVAATSENTVGLLVGEDTPGSILSITVSRQGRMHTVSLKRACADELADRKRMFDLLQRLRGIAADKAEEQAVAVVEETTQLWNKMMEADQVHDEKIVSNVMVMQAAAGLSVRKLREHLKHLHSLSASILSGASGIHMSEAALLAQLSKAKSDASHAQRQAGNATPCHLFILSSRGRRLTARSVKTTALWQRACQSGSRMSRRADRAARARGSARSCRRGANPSTFPGSARANLPR